MPCNIPVVVIGNTQIEENIQDHGKVEQRKIKTIVLVAYKVLYRAVNSKNPKGFNQQIEENQQYQVCNKFSFQNILNQLDIWFDRKKKLCL